MSCLTRVKNGAVTPVLIGTLNYQLETHLIGQLKYRTGVNFASSSMTASLVYEKESVRANAHVMLSLKNTLVGVDVSRSFRDNDVRLKAAAQYGFLGLVVSYGVEKRLTQFSRIDATMIVSTLEGVVLHLEYVERFSLSLSL